MLDTMDFSQSSAGKQYDEVHLGSETLLENTRLGSSLVTCDTEIEADLDKQRFIEIVMWIRDDKKEKISNKQLKDKFEMGYDRANRFLQMLEDAGIISEQKKGTKLPRTVNQDKLEEFLNSHGDRHWTHLICRPMWSQCRIKTRSLLLRFQMSKRSFHPLLCLDPHDLNVTTGS